MTGGLDGFLLGEMLFSESGKRKVESKKTRPNRSSGLSVPPKAHGTPPDVGSQISNFLLVFRAVLVLSGWVSGFHQKTLQQ